MNNKNEAEYHVKKNVDRGGNYPPRPQRCCFVKSKPLAFSQFSLLSPLLKLFIDPFTVLYLILLSDVIHQI